MKSPGFTLIELMVGILITAILGGILYNGLTQSQRALSIVERITDTSMRILIAQRQLTRDISGAYIPLSILEPPKKQEKAETEEASATPEKKAEPKKEAAPAEKKSEQATAEEKEALKKLLATAFNGTTEQEQLKQLLFVTMNPLDIYWSTTSGRAKTRNEKVMYSLEPDQTTKKPSFKLMRTTTYLKDGKETHLAQELISHIKKMSVEYTLIVEEEPKEEAKAEASKPAEGKAAPAQPAKKEQAAPKEPPKKEIKKFSEWDVMAMQENDVRLQKKVPNYVTISLALWTPAQDRIESFSFIIPIPWEPITPKQPEKQDDAKQESKNPEAPTETKQESKPSASPPVAGKK